MHSINEIIYFDDESRVMVKLYSGNQLIMDSESKISFLHVKGKAVFYYPLLYFCEANSLIP